MHEIGDRLAAVHRRRRVVRVVEEHQAGALRSGGHAVEVEAERGVDLDLRDRMTQSRRHLRTVFERRGGGHQAARRRRERADGGLENFLGTGAEHDILWLGAELGGNRGDQRAVGGRAVERIASRFGKLAHDRVERRLARTKRVFVAADPDRFDPGRQRRSRGALRRLCRLRLVVLVAARGNPEACVKGRIRSSPAQDVKKTATRLAHAILPTSECQRVEYYAPLQGASNAHVAGRERQALLFRQFRYAISGRRTTAKVGQR